MQQDLKIWKVTNDCSPFPPKTLRGDQSQCLDIAPNQCMIFWDTVFLATVKGILADLSDPYPSSATVWISSTWVLATLVQYHTPSQTLLPTYMGEVCLLAQDRQNQVRFCNIDYICRKRRLSWWKNSPFCFWRNLWWTVTPTFCLQVNPWTGFNYIIFRGTVCDQGLKDQSYSLFWLHTDLSFVSTLQIPTTSACLVWGKEKSNTDFSQSRIPLPSPIHY